MAKRGKGTKYARKYVKATQDEMRHIIIPKAADYCARIRAERGLTPQQYRECLRVVIQQLIRGEEPSY